MVSVGGQEHCVTVVQDGTLCTGLSAILLNYRNMRGDGDNREVTSNGSYRKQCLLLQSSHFMFQQITHNYILSADMILP